MDFLIQIGPLALPSRLRRLADRMTQDITLLYKELNIDFEPRWFPIFCLLNCKSPMGVVDIARLLGVSHPAVNQIAGEMIEMGLIDALKDETDKRKRLLSLSDKGRAMTPVLEDAWERIQWTMKGLLGETGGDVMGMLANLETLMEQQGIYGRFIAEQMEPPRSDVEIVEYRPEFREAFRRLNLEDLDGDKGRPMLPEEEKLLRDPESEILGKGGTILFALDRNHANGKPSEEVLGACVLIRKAKGTLEVSRMAIVEKAHNARIGKRLLTASIEKARDLEVDQLLLETNVAHELATLNLFRNLGFVLVQDESATGLSSANAANKTRMRLDL